MIYLFWIGTYRNFTAIRKLSYLCNIIMCFVAFTFLIFAAIMIHDYWQLFIAEDVFATIITASVLQISSAVVGLIGASRAPLFHSTRSRNVFLLVYVLMICTSFAFQGFNTNRVAGAEQLSLLTTCKTLNSPSFCCDNLESGMYAKIIDRPDLWNKVESKYSCYGFQCNDTLGWIGANSFSNTYHNFFPNSVCTSSSFPLEAPYSQWRPVFQDFYNHYNGSLPNYCSPFPMSCYNVVVTGKVLPSFFYFLVAEVLMCTLMSVCLILAVLMATCKFRGLTVEGTRDDGAEYQIFG